jgi:hypothetical protein
MAVSTSPVAEQTRQIICNNFGRVAIDSLGLTTLRDIDKESNLAQIIITYSMVVPLQPAEKWLSMKMPVGKFTLPLKVAWLNSYEKVVDDINTVVVWVVEIVKDHNLVIRPKTSRLRTSCEPKKLFHPDFHHFERLPNMTSSSVCHGPRDIADEGTLNRFMLAPHRAAFL